MFKKKHKRMLIVEALLAIAVLAMICGMGVRSLRNAMLHEQNLVHDMLWELEASKVISTIQHEVSKMNLNQLIKDRIFLSANEGCASWPRRLVRYRYVAEGIIISQNSLFVIPIDIEFIINDKSVFKTKRWLFIDYMEEVI